MFVWPVKGGRGRRRKMVPQYPRTVSPSKSPVIDLPPPGELGDPLSDEDDRTAFNQIEATLSPVPDVVSTWSADTEMIIKSEPVDDVGSLTSESHPPLPFQYVEHSYSYMEHIGVSSGGNQYENLLATEDESTSRTSGRKWVSDELSSICTGDGSDRKGINIPVRIRKKYAPLITSRLIIPVVRVARTASMEQSVMENAANEMNALHNGLDRRADPNGETNSQHLSASADVGYFYRCLDIVWSIGVILGENGGLTPHLLEWGTDPHCRSLSSQKFCLQNE